jgi:hypothetical protein
VSVRHQAADALPLVNLITQVQVTLRRRAAATATLWALAGALVGLAALLMADAACGFGGVRFLAYGGGSMVGLLAVVTAALAARRRVPSAFYVARLIEVQRPELKNALITLVEFQYDGASDPSMTAAVGRRVARVLAHVEPAEFLPAPAMRRPVAATVLSAILMGIGFWLAQGVLFAPWSQAAEASLVSGHSSITRADDPTQVAVVPGSAETAPQAPSAQERANPPSAASPKAGGPGAQGKAGAGGSSSASGSSSGGATPADGAMVVGQGQEGASGDTHGGAAGSPAAGGSGEGHIPGTAMASAGAPDAAAGEKGQVPGGPDGSKPKSGQGGGISSATGFGGGSEGNLKARPPYTGPAPLQPRPQNTEFPRQALDTMRQVPRLMNQQHPSQDDPRTAAYLGKMGTGNADAVRYSAAWQRGPETAAAAAERAGPVGAVGETPRTAELIPAGLGTEGSPFSGKVAAARDGKRDLVQGDDVRVSARLRPAVAAYFEVVGRMAAARPAKDSSDESDRRPASGH